MALLEAFVKEPLPNPSFPIQDKEARMGNPLKARLLNLLVQDPVLPDHFAGGIGKEEVLNLPATGKLLKHRNRIIADSDKLDLCRLDLLQVVLQFN